MNNQLHLENATIEHEKILLSWANESEVRKQSFQTHLITPEEHHSWLLKILNSKYRRLFVLYYKDTPIGTGRIDIEHIYSTISYSIAADYRGKGYGTAIIHLLSKYIEENLHCLYIIAQTKKENFKSQKALMANGFVKYIDDNKYIFIKHLVSKCNTENIIFRTDGNSTLGMGHIMRSISIATAFKKKNCNVIFICADESASKKVNEFGFKAITLNTDYKNMGEELPYLHEIFKNIRPKFIVVDSYQATNDYLKNLQNYSNTVYIEDIFNSVHPVYAVLNYNISCDKQKYYANYKNTKLFLGTDYIPLREEFQNALPITIKNKVSNIMITTGATDPYNISLNVLEKALNDKNISDMNYHIVIGGFYTDKLKEKLYKIKERCQNVFLYENVKMSKLMKDMDIATSAAGSTVYELCAFGIPAVLYAFVDNQLEILKYMSDSSMCCGYYPENNQIVMDNIIKSVNLLVKNVDKRTGIHKSCLKLLNKNGADRFANELLSDI